MLLLRNIDNILNKFTMYRLTLYALIALALSALILSVFGILDFDPIKLTLSGTILVATCYITNHIFARLFKAVINIESSLISGLILFFLMAPIENTEGAIILIVAATIAMASKYILAINKKHIFNPAALAAFALSFNPNTLAVWWVGTPALLPIALITGLLVVRKIRRFRLFFSFIIAGVLSIVFFGYLNGSGFMEVLPQVFTSWPIIYFGTYMLTEPLTTPPTKKLQMIYGGLTGILFGMPLNLGIFYSSPEFALLIANLFSYLTSPKKNLLLKLTERVKLAPDIYGFRFASDQTLNFAAGQYLEWTLKHNRADSRGNRRYFTIASSPTSNTLELGVKISENSSSYKKALLNMKPGDKIFASHLSGDFTLSENKDVKLVFIAGGIGITPFKSIIEYFISSKQKKDITLFYACAAPSEFVYKEVFDKAGYSIGLKTIYVVTREENASKEWKGKVGRINEEMLKSEVPDFKERIFYLSGPNAMVEGYKDLLSKLGIPKTQIVTDYFPGF